jgi:hypothetical protein
MRVKQNIPMLHTIDIREDSMKLSVLRFYAVALILLVCMGCATDLVMNNTRDSKDQKSVSDDQK